MRARSSLPPIEPALLVVLGVLLLIPGSSIADEIVVPDDFVTIQAAIDFASPGDQVWVRPGTYVENLLVRGKSIQLTSFDGPAVTIIDGSAPTRPDTLSVVTAIEVEDLHLAGFTLRNGHGGIDFGELSGDDSGGGLALGATNGTIRDCVIEDNSCGGNGGGIHVVLGSPLIADCVVRDNLCGSNGAGIHAYVGSPTIERCTIENNLAGEDSRGGGISINYFGASQITDCIVSGNRARVGAGILTQYSSSATILRTLVIGNATTILGSGGGIVLDGGSSRVEGCTIVRNTSPFAAGIGMPTGSALTRSIVAFNHGGPGLSCLGPVTVDCCDIFGNEGGDELCGIDGGGNFSLDPLLCSDYSIAATSPCAPENSPASCGLIGALAVGCTEAIEPATWGGIKVRYRD